MQLDVDTTCGAPGAVTATVDPATCKMTLSGAAAVGLPVEGKVDGSGFTLQEGDGARHCLSEERAPGEYALRCYDTHDPNTIGCGGSDLPACDGTLRIAAGSPP